MDLENIAQFSDSITKGYGVDAAVIEAIMAGDGDINYKEFLLGLFRGIDELEVLGLLAEEDTFSAKVELANALAWAGTKIRDFDERTSKN